MSLYFKRTLSVTGLIVCCLWQVGWGQGFAGGTGQRDDPYQIATVDQLMVLTHDPNLYNEHFVLVDDIDLAGQVFSKAPIAGDVTEFDFTYDGKPFTGTFDGAGHTIANLTIDIGLPANGFDFLGLFGSVEKGAVIKDLELVDVSIKGGTNSDYLGGLAGQAFETTVTNCRVSGTVTSGLNAQCLGGLIGAGRDAVIENCQSTCSVAGDENSGYLGGLIGNLINGTLTDCNVTATVQGGTQSVAVGGLVGLASNVTATNCQSQSTVSGGIASSCVGGVIGTIGTGNLTHCHSTASVEGASESFEIGGLVGNASNATMTGCYSAGTVVGGINTDYLGGLVGLFQKNYNWVWIQANIIDCYSECNVTGSDNSDHVGGLVGQNSSNAKIYRSHATGAVYAEEEVGGLVGWNNGALVDCYATGNVSSAIDADRLGGLAGRNRGYICGCYATGSVTGDFNSDHMGGLVGKNEYAILDSYATGAVTGGQEADELGGFVGFNDDNVTLIHRCYSTGSVTSLSTSDRIGGFVGYHRNGHIRRCFWNIETSGTSNGIGVKGTSQDEDDVVGLTTAQMQNPGSFTGWGFAGATATGLNHQWVMAVEVSAPVLWWQRPEAVPLPSFSGGSGTEDDPYLIADRIDLNSIGYNPRVLDKHYRLVADFDLTGGLKMIGNELHPFTGTFDGNGHTLDNVTVIDKAGYEDSMGMFGCVDSGGQIRNLALNIEIENTGIEAVGGLVACATQTIVEDCHVVGTVGGGDCTAALIGYGDRCHIVNCSAGATVTANRYGGVLMAYNDQGQITGCRSDGSIEGYNSCGGLVGYISHGVLTYSGNTASVTVRWDDIGGLLGYGEFSEIAHCFNTGSVSGNYHVGGIVGENQSSQMSFTYSTGSVTGDFSVGGLAGDVSEGSLFHCYSTGAVVGENSSLTGGLIGNFVPGSQIDMSVVGCFWDTETSGQTKSEGGRGLPTAQMKRIDTYLAAGWDFIDETENGTEDIWFMPEADYPHLAWETQN